MPLDKGVILTGVRFLGQSPLEYYNASYSNLLFTLFERNFKPKLRPDPFHLTLFKDFSKTLCDDIAESWKQFSDNLQQKTYEEWVNDHNWSAKKKKNYIDQINRQLVDVTGREYRLCFNTMVKAGEMFQHSNKIRDHNGAIINDPDHKPRLIADPAHTVKGLLMYLNWYFISVIK